MGPRFQPMPAPKTESAREAARTFFCDLCNKGYSRMPEYEAHLSSYEHTHAQRHRDSKNFMKNPLGKNASEAQRKTAEKDKKGAGLISVKLDSTPAKTGGGFKKGGFKSAGFKKISAPGEEKNGNESKTDDQPASASRRIPGLPMADDAIDVDGDEDGEEGEDQSQDYSFWWSRNPGFEVYDPTRPAGCSSNCTCRTQHRGCEAGCQVCTTLGPVPG